MAPTAGRGGAAGLDAGALAVAGAGAIDSDTNDSSGSDGDDDDDDDDDDDAGSEEAASVSGASSSSSEDDDSDSDGDADDEGYNAANDDDAEVDGGDVGPGQSRLEAVARALRLLCAGDPLQAGGVERLSELCVAWEEETGATAGQAITVLRLASDGAVQEAAELGLV